MLRYCLIILMLIISCSDSKKLNINGYWVAEYRTKILPNGMIQNCDPTTVLLRPIYFRGFQIANDSINYYLSIYTCNKWTREKFHFELTKDSIIVYNNCNQIFTSHKIYSIDSNNMALYDYNDYDSILTCYKKLDLRQIVPPDCDVIVLSSSGCFGSCPIDDIAIYNSDSLSYFGERYVKNIGYNKGLFKFPKEELKLIDLQKYDSAYYAGPTDNEEITLTFAKNGKIIKSISDYGHSAPIEIQWLVDKLRNIDQYRLEKIYSPISQVFINLHSYNFRKENMIFSLTKAESFYLFELLNNGAITKQNFKPTYVVDFNTDYIYSPSYEEIDNDPYNENARIQINKIETDGQYYQFHLRDKKSFIVDLGFNFIQLNHLDKRLTKINK